MWYKIKYILAVSFILVSCTDPSEVVGSMKINDYQPREVGIYWLYQIDSITYSNKGNTKDTSRFFEKQEIIALENTDLGQKATLEFSTSKFKDSLYNYSRTEFILFEHQKIIYSENNLQFIKLGEPIQLGTKIPWDGNALFDVNSTEVFVQGESFDLYKDWNYVYKSFMESEKIAEITFNSVLSIQQVNWFDILSKRYAIEKYAKGVGMIQQIHEMYNTQCNDCPDKSWEEKAEEGYALTKTLLDFGR